MYCVTAEQELEVFVLKAAVGKEFAVVKILVAVKNSSLEGAVIYRSAVYGDIKRSGKKERGFPGLLFGQGKALLSSGSPRRR